MTQATIPVVVATQRINGVILPDVLFTPDTAEDHADLVRMGAVREPTEAELLLHERMLENAAKAQATGKPQLDHDGNGKAGGSKPRGRRTATVTQTPAPAAGGETGNGEAGNGDEAGGAGNGDAGDNAAAAIG